MIINIKINIIIYKLSFFINIEKLNYKKIYFKLQKDFKKTNYTSNNFKQGSN